MKYGIQHRPSNIGAGWRRSHVVEADSPKAALISEYGDRLYKHEIDNMYHTGDPSHPLSVRGDFEVSAVPFGDWVEESRRITGDESFEPREDYRFRLSDHILVVHIGS